MIPDPIEALARRICQKHNYTFVRQCDAGAFKKTFQVRDASGIDLALKLVVNPIDPARIQREIDAQRACRHNHISRLVEVGTFDNSGIQLVYFVEEFLSGGTLSARLAAGLLPCAEGSQLAIGLTEALSHLMPLELVHRDIKPENIMYRADGTPVLVDLGIARHLGESSLTQTAQARGPCTPAYAAPEQLLNAKHLIDWRSDQFSLGITMSLALLGMHPYSGSMAINHAVVDHMARRDPPVQQFIDAARNAGLEVLVKMVEPWPIKRFARPGQLVAAWRTTGGTP